MCKLQISSMAEQKETPYSVSLTLTFTDNNFRSQHTMDFFPWKVETEVGQAGRQ